MIHNINPVLLTRAIKVILVGAGGTGSHVLKRLARIHLAMTELGHPGGLEVLVIDPDTVSKSNVGRQDFFPSDVGQNKASVLVNRCNMGMLTRWKAEQEKVTGTSRFSIQPDIVIGCVDNRLGRAAILSSITSSISSSAYWLDFGNAQHSGQVILGQVVSSRFKLENRLPHAADLFPEIVDGKLDDTDDTPSCSLAEALEKQSLFVNDKCALEGCSMLNDLFRYGRISHHGLFINIKSGRTTPLAIDPEAWKRFGFVVKTKKPRQKKAA